MSALEKELNTCFLIRNTRGVELSESGKELYAYAVQMLEIEKTIKGRFGKEIKPEGNVLRIGASTVPAQYILPNVMSTFHAEYPGEKIEAFLRQTVKELSIGFFPIILILDLQEP